MTVHACGRIVTVTSQFKVLRRVPSGAVAPFDFASKCPTAVVRTLIDSKRVVADSVVYEQQEQNDDQGEEKC
jgi:hypothetical protein